MAEIRKLLEGENVYLRKFEPEDLEFLYSVENNTDFWSVSETQSPYSRWQLKEHIANSVYDIFTTKELRLLVIDKHLGHKVGIIDLFEYDPLNNRCGLGLLILPEYRKRGFASEVVGIIKNYVFKVLMLKQVWCIIETDNQACLSIFYRYGFTSAGVLKSWKRIGEACYKDVEFLQCFG